MKEIKVCTEEGVNLPDFETIDSISANLKAFKIINVYKGNQEVSEEKLQKIITNFNEKGFIYLRDFERVLLGTGIYISLPENIEAQIRPKASISLKRGLDVKLQTISADYKGEIGIILCNNTPFLNPLSKGEDIAEIVFNEVIIPRFKRVSKEKIIK